MGSRCPKVQKKGREQVPPTAAEGPGLATRQVSAFLCLFALSFIGNNREFELLELPILEGDLWGQLRNLACWIAGAAALSAGSRIALLAVGLSIPLALALDPNLSNHETLYAHVCISIVAVYASRVLAERRLRVDLAQLHASLAALLRVEFLVFYFWVAFHKLNPHFLDPATSCGVHLLHETLFYVPALPVPPGFDRVVGPLTLAVEISLPLLLLSPLTRRYGVLLGLGFHSALTIGFPAFQHAVFGFLLLFVPDAELGLAVARLRTLLSSRPAAHSREWLGRAGSRALLGLLLALALNLFAQWAQQPGGLKVFGQYSYRLALFLSNAVFALGYLGLCLRGRGFGVPWSLPARPRIAPVLWLLPVALFLQGAQPHLGFKAVQSFAMFSNLDTENGQSNHLLLPGSWQLSNNLNDPVFVHAGSHPWLRQLSDPGAMQRSILRAARRPKLAQPWLALRRRATEMARAGVTDLRVVYTRGGLRHEVENAENDPELSGAGFLARNYLRTRPMVRRHHGPCRW
jgi:hypothetical protein